VDEDLASKSASSLAVIGLKLRAVRAGSKIARESRLVIKKLAVKFMAKYRRSTVLRLLFRIWWSPLGALESRTGVPLHAI
jgi:hypothetical protein